LKWGTLLDAASELFLRGDFVLTTVLAEAADDQLGVRTFRCPSWIERFANDRAGYEYDSLAHHTNFP
jgi:hypothetical protein